MTTQTRMTLDEFLALPEQNPYREFLRGEVYEKVPPDNPHGYSIAELSHDLTSHVRSGKLPFKVGTEIRHVDRAEDWTYLPDLDVTRLDRLPEQWRRRRQGPLGVVPDLAIEVLSSDDRAAYLLERIELYFRAGLRLLWLIDPGAETVRARRPGIAETVHRAPEVIDAAPVLPDFTLDIGEFFDRVYERQR